MVSGWGQTAFTLYDAPTNPQKQVNVGIVPYNVCRTSYSNPSLLGNNVDFYLDPTGEICAGGQTMKDACTVRQVQIFIITRNTIYVILFI